MRRVLGPACVALALAGASCGCKRSVTTADAGAIAVAPEEPIPAPDGVLLEAAVRDPDAAWSRLQHAVGGAFALLPSTIGQIACGLLGVDASLGVLVDGHATAYAVVVRRVGGAGAIPSGTRVDGVGWVVAMRLTDDGARRAVATALDVPAGFTQRIEAGMRVLTRADAPGAGAVAFARRWLVVARDEHDLVESGPYVFRTLPVEASLASPTSFIARASHGALVGPIAATLAEYWATARSWLLEQGRIERARHGGRQPDFGDPEAIVGALEPAVLRRLASIADSQEVRIEGETGADDVTVEVRAATSDAAARATDDASALFAGDASALGDARPLADAAADAPLALLVRDDAAERADTAHELSAGLAQALGSRLRDDQARAIDTAFGHWGRGRGDWVVVGLAGGADGGFWLRGPAADEAIASRAVREMLELSRLPPLRAPLEGWLHRLPVVFGPAAGNVAIATFPAADSAAPQPTEGVAWEVSGGEVAVGVGSRPLQRLADATSRRARLGDEARTARVLAGLGDSASFAALAQPLRFGAPPAPAASAPLGFACGRRGGEFWARIDIADELLDAVVRMESGL